ncbi:MAG: GntP family permease [Actinomycetota bacterium]|nr:GntP family permease [Actinomycetota bacterium]
MSDTLIVLHTAIAIIAIVLLIVVAKVDPVPSLVIGTLYLGVAAGLGFGDTIGTLVRGFGDIMAEVGLLIGFGVLMGMLLTAMGALQKLVELLLRILGPRRLPYALSAALSTIFPSIYVDVQLVLASPLARSAAPRIGRNGLALMGGALTAGILVGYVFVVPGLGTVAIAGLLEVPLGTMLIYGTLIGLPTAVLTTFIYSRLLKYGLWNEAKDEAHFEDMVLGSPDAVAEEVREEGPAITTPEGDPSVAEDARKGTPAATERETAHHSPPLFVSLLPIVVALVLIAFGAVAEATGLEAGVIAFLGDPVFALFLGLLGAYLLAWRTLTKEHVEEAMHKGFNATGQILLITGIGGSLGAVIGETGLDKILGGFFSAEAGTPDLVTIVLAWLIAAILHLAIGSISVAAITAAGILAPILGGIEVPTVVLGLAIGSGALFALQVNSNFFWMFQTLVGLTTQGTLKALTLVTSMASVVSLLLILALSFVV